MTTTEMDTTIEQHNDQPTLPYPHTNSQCNKHISDQSEKLWVNDTSVNHLSKVILNQLELDRQKRVESGDHDNITPPQYSDPIFKMIPPIQSTQHMRFNLIR
jgi:hypothetical protein